MVRYCGQLMRLVTVVKVRVISSPTSTVAVAFTSNYTTISVVSTPILTEMAVVKIVIRMMPAIFEEAIT
jgi:hypothetical protein